MGQVIEILRRIEALHINTLAAVVIAALLAALLEQRWRRRHTPHFSQTHLEVAPPLEALRPRKAKAKAKAKR
jgi:hypothetical protein